MNELDLPPYDGSMPVDIWKAIRQRDLKRISAQNSALMKARDASGKPLYKVTSGGNLSRVKPLSPATRKQVIQRDGVCVECSASTPFEVHHIKRYIDGGSNEPDNLQTLCEPCHRSKGGR